MNNNSLYEIDKNLNSLLEQGYNLECIDIETGEINQDKVNELIEQYQCDRSDKLENVALYIKSLEDDIAASKTYEKSLAERRKAKEKKCDSLKNYLANSLEQFEQKHFETVKVAVQMRKSTAVSINKSLLHKDWMREIVKYEPDKTRLKTALSLGQKIDGAELVTNNNITIK